MKLWIWSDLHTERNPSNIWTLNGVEPPAGADIIVCAGDLAHAGDWHWLAKQLVEIFDMPIILVPGNHEFYKQDTMEVALDAMLDVERQSIKEGWKHPVYVLHRKTIILDDVRFVGATGWVDFKPGLEDLAAEQRDIEMMYRFREAPSVLNDFRLIWPEKTPSGLRPSQMLDMHEADREYIIGELQKPFDGSTVVVTHHLPHPDCIVEAYRGEPESRVNYLFANSQDAFSDVMHSDMAPALWICGHTHEVVDVSIGNTRVACNPHGYDYEYGKNGFDWNLC